MGATIIAIANQKGGVGKTTTALSLTAALDRAGKKVLLLDLDPHICASVHMRLYPEEHKNTLYSLFAAMAHADLDEEQLCALWNRIILPLEGRTWQTVCGDTRLAEVEGDVRDRRNKGYLLRDALVVLRGRYDYIILDCPPQMGVMLVNALVAADLLIIPIQTDFLALHGLKLLFDTLRTLNKALPSSIRYKTLPTMFDKRANACKRVLTLLEHKMGDAVFSSIIPMDTRFREASAMGQVIYDETPRSKGALAYTALAEEVMLLC